MTNIIDKNEEAVRKALPELKMPPKAEKSYAPPEERGVHEQIEEIQELLDLAVARLKILKSRIGQFDDMQRRFYNGIKP